MKLRLKLALLSAALCALAIAACCAVMILSANRNSLSNAVENAVAEHHMLVSSMDNALSSTYEPDHSDIARSSLSKYLFRRFSSNTFTTSQYVLELDGEYLYNASGVDIKLLLKREEVETLTVDDGSVSYAILPISGRRHIAVGSSLQQSGRQYGIYLLKDIEQVYEDNGMLAARIAGIGGAFILLSAGVISYAVYRTLRSLKGLEAGADAIAQGDYARRLPVKGSDEIAALSGSFNAMAEAVERRIAELNDLAESRRLLFGALTHELKTPMTAIIGYSEALMRTKLTEDQSAEAIEYINAECTRMERLSGKLMGLMSLEDAEGLRLVSAPVSELFAAVEMTLRPIADNEGIELTISCDDTILPMDQDLMASLVINLFDNARKAGAKHIHLMCLDRVISMEDDGCGIPGEALKRITEPFYMVDKSRSRKAGGAGLGLALVERITGLHGGELRIHSQTDVGTVAEITFR